jgi:hypothetical protein
MPVFESNTDDGTSFGASTSGYDIVRRHAYSLELLHNTRFSENSAWFSYRYAGFGLPLLDFSASQEYSNGRVTGSLNDQLFDLGSIAQRDRLFSLAATFIRPRFRTYSQLSVGAEIEKFAYATDPDTLLSLLNPFFRSTPTYPAIVGSFGWSNTQRPGLSISPEDGVTLSMTARQRWQYGTSGGSSRSFVGMSTGFKSLDLPGFAHHVVALRAAGGITDERSPDRFSAGGTSGTLLEVFPGYTVGTQRRTFGVRGYPAGAEGGIRAYSGAIEYRAPLFAPSRGFRYIPVFIDRTSFTLFGETGRAFCPKEVSDGVCRPGDSSNPAMTSAGAELNIDTGLLLDFQARMRAGVAFPLAHREELGANAAQFYATFGASF